MTKHVPDARTVQRHMQQISNRASNPYDKIFGFALEASCTRSFEKGSLLRRLKRSYSLSQKYNNSGYESICLDSYLKLHFLKEQIDYYEIIIKP